jgi:hypothetical protein
MDTCHRRQRTPQAVQPSLTATAGRQVLGRPNGGSSRDLRPCRCVTRAVNADERNEPRYNPRICGAEKLSPGPIGTGARFRAEADGTRMSWSWVVRPRGLYRLLSPVIASVGRRQEQENLGGLKRFLEARKELAPEASLPRSRPMAPGQPTRSVR